MSAARQRLEIGGRAYTMATDVRDNPALRAAFNALSVEVFGLDFEPWHAAGWWHKSPFYPHLLLDEDGAAAANVSVSDMAFLSRGRRRRYAQLGTVMTAPAHRGRGLARALAGQVLDEWLPRCDGMFLYANAGVTAFYPKLGFAPAAEAACEAAVPGAGGAPPARRLEMDDAAGVALLLEAYARGNPHSALAFTDNPGLVMFYCGGPMKADVWYIDAWRTAAVAACAGGTLHCADVYGPPGPTLAGVLAALAVAAGAARVRLGFAPKSTAGYSMAPLCPEEDGLFYHTGGENPLDSGITRLPRLAQT